MEDNSKTLKKKSKQSSMLVASMSIGISVEVLERLAPLIYSYNRFWNDKSLENFNFAYDNIEIAKLEAHQAYLAEAIIKIQNNQNSNGQNP